jgi:hypothetical protein
MWCAFWMYFSTNTWRQQQQQTTSEIRKGSRQKRHRCGCQE